MPKKHLTRPQAINKLLQEKVLTTGMLKGLDIRFETFLRFSQFPKDKQNDFIGKLIKYYSIIKKDYLP